MFKAVRRRENLVKSQDCADNGVATHYRNMIDGASKESQYKKAVPRKTENSLALKLVISVLTEHGTQSADCRSQQMAALDDKEDNRHGQRQQYHLWFSWQRIPMNTYNITICSF